MGRDRDPRQTGEENVYRLSERVFGFARQVNSPATGGADDDVASPMDTATTSVTTGAPETADRTDHHRDPDAPLKSIVQRDLFILLEAPAEPDRSMAKVVQNGDHKYVLVFDDKQRAANVAGDDAHVSLVAGRALVQLLKGGGVGLVLNLGDPTNAELMHASAIDAFELAADETATDDDATEAPAISVDLPDIDTVIDAVMDKSNELSDDFASESFAPRAQKSSPEPEKTVERRISDDMASSDETDETDETDDDVGKSSALDKENLKALMAPRDFPDSVQLALAERLSGMADLCESALLLRAEYGDGRTGFIVGFAGAAQSDHSALENAVVEVLGSSHRRDIEMRISFLSRDDPSLSRISRLGATLI